MRNRRKWFWLLGVLLVFVALYFLNNRFGWFPLPWQMTDQDSFAEGQMPETPLVETTPIQRAVDFIPDLSVAGKLEFRTIYEIKAPFEEVVADVFVENGAMVRAGDPLLALKTDKLGERLSSAWLELTKKRQALADLVQEDSAVALMEAQAELLAAQEELEKLEKGPSSADTFSAQLAISEAQLANQELLARNDANSAKARETRYALKQAENSLRQAQTAYDAIAWKGDIAASAEATTLQNATITYESAKNSYDQALEPPTELELQKAQNAIAQAQSAYNKLFTPATPAQFEQAKVRIAKAEAKLTEVQAGPSSLKMQEAEAQVIEALRQVEEIRTKLLNTSRLQSPLDGQVVKLPAKPGQLVKEGDTVAIVVAPHEFKLSVAVSELYVLRIATGMAVDITLDVLPDSHLTGTVTAIAPPTVQTGDSNESSSSGAQFTTYPVTVVVSDSLVTENLRAGMSAQVTFVGSNQLPADSWLVPASSLEPTGEGTATLQVTRGETPLSLDVAVTDQTQGEWVVVVSSELQDGDLVVGSTTSMLDSQQFSEGMFVP
jgi:multidrug resistance efflux pump